MPLMICPKCEYERQPDDNASTPDYECPNCGVIYAKYKKIEYKKQQDADKKTVPFFIKLIFLIPLWILGLAFSYFLMPGGNYLIFIGFILVFNWVLMGFDLALEPNPKSIVILVVLALLFMPYFSSYEATLDTITGFDGAQQRKDAEAAGFFESTRYKAHLAKIQAEQKVQAEIQRVEDAKHAILDAKIAAENEKKLAAAKLAKEAACKKSLICMGDHLIVTAGIYCREPIERLAKYDYKWTDGWLTPKFSRYHWKGLFKKIITMKGDELKLQNGFGVMVKYNYSCDIDVETEKPIAVRVNPGRL